MVKNHTSATDYPLRVQKFLDKEVDLGAIWGLFTTLLMEEGHVSPLMSHRKDLMSVALLLTFHMVINIR